MKSKTKVNSQSRRKRSPELLDTIMDAKKNEKWYRVSEVLASPRKNKIEKNLDNISKDSKDGEVVVVPGKVLSMGELNKKVRIVALDFSESAKEKILKSGNKFSTILEEIKTNPEAKGVKILE
ncbi:MAG: 50S ribosomal protein L18e [Candidatus Nanoarchaeia archaeon]